jgi:glycosyltransferase involved in cell wall biosynthesis
MSKQIKIIHFISSIRRGGMERQLSTIYKYSNKDDYSTKIYCFNASKNSYLEEFNVSLDDLILCNKKSLIERIVFTYKIFKKEKPTIVFSWGIIESIISLLLLPFFRYTFINGSIRHGIVAKKWSHRLRSWILHLSSNIIANSKAGLKANGLKRGEILYNGLDDKFFEDVQLEEKWIKIQSSLAKPVLTSVANLVPYKDYFTVLNALSILKKEGLSFSYLIIGTGPMKPEIELKISELDLSNNIKLIGGTSFIKEYLSISDIFIHSSKGEGCSNAILEAMASGLPIIASNVGGTSEIVHPEFGVLFEYQNTEQLANNLRNLIMNPESCKKMGEKAKVYSQANFSNSKMIEEYSNLMNKYSKKRSQWP